ncbi:MAG: hypothetical protein OXB93_03375 [Cytophagales bacterium]|nr:hypothetical protein [Cytophagales bacterium]
MYLLSLSLLLNHLLPPNWRKTWRERWMRTWMEALEPAYRGLLIFRKEIKHQTNTQAQVLTLEYHLNLIANTYGRIYLSDDEERGAFFRIHMPSTLSLEVMEQINRFLDVHLLAGIQYEFVGYGQ